VIDVYVPEHALTAESAANVLKELTDALLKWTDASEVPIARDNTMAYLHAMPSAHVTAGGKPATFVRVEVKVPEVVLSTIERRRGFIADATAIVSALSLDGHVPERTWVTISNTVDGGWGLGGHGLTNAELDDI
jgi:phenylpyruvate tautomerase PptA (4-oxalocrotonate tautomerase family)